MYIRELTSAERDEHINNHPEDAEHETIYEVKYMSGINWKTKLIDVETKDMLDRAMAFARKELRTDLQQLILGKTLT